MTFGFCIKLRCYWLPVFDFSHKLIKKRIFKTFYYFYNIYFLIAFIKLPYEKLKINLSFQTNKNIETYSTDF